MARRKNNKLTLTGAVIVIAVGLVFKLVDQQYNLSGTQSSNTNYATTTQVVKQTGIDYGSVEDTHPTETLASSVLTANVKKQLKTDSIKFNGAGAFVLANDKNNLNAKVTSAPYVQLSQQDQLRRPGVANAWLTKAARQYQNRTETGNDAKIYPVGWEQLTIGGRYSQLYNRGHSIGYAIAGNIKSFDASEANYQNITTQTAWANQASNGDANNTGQNYYENLVRKALDNNQKVRYRVTPLYDGNNLVPSGSKMEAKSADGSLQFSVFVPNVEPGVVINYATGSAKLSN
ncbi:MAG: DNA/RNA non-specific endonuclease [Lactobacillaceae bacterium]|jgi:DNA-entry nuclease|nr:DNA/RNA non-specific endonuclease [Lactobacillaceae bacterium]